MPISQKQREIQDKKVQKEEASWENNDSSSSDEEEATEHANVCFMTQEEDEEQYTELLNAFHEFYDDLKNDKIKNKALLKENERLNKENSVYIS